MTEQLSEFIFNIFLFYLPLLFSLCFHELAHGWVAKKKGDFTAFYEGRLTLNPLAHIDYLGTVILPMIFLWTNSPLFFGWAKPVPVNPGAFQNPKKDLFWVAFAGPLSNILLAFAVSLILTVLYTVQQVHSLSFYKPLVAMMEMLIYVNMFLAIFNLIPLHPLDGGKIMARFLPLRWNIFLEKYQNYGYMLLIALIFLGAFHLIVPIILGASHSLMNLARGLSQLLLSL